MSLRLCGLVPARVGSFELALSQLIRGFVDALSGGQTLPQLLDLFLWIFDRFCAAVAVLSTSIGSKDFDIDGL
jgi:hypothetical protein